MSSENEIEIGDDLEIRALHRRTSAGGAWIRGRLNGHAFDALVFPEHAENRDWEIADSRISKLWIGRLADRATVFNWDRGSDVLAADETVQQIVDFLCEGLADLAWPKDGAR